MLKIIFVPALLFAVLYNSHAQTKPRFGSHNYIGLLEGEQGSYFQIQSVNGIQYGTWFAGAGTGIDYYYFRSVPLFLSVSKDLRNRERTFYLSADGGVNWLWDKETQGFPNGYARGDFRPSLYLGGGFGYKVGLKNKRDALLFSLGYSVKHLRESLTNTLPCQIPPCPTTTDRVNYHFNRLSLRAGWRFR